MTDIYNSKKRSEIMSVISGKETKLEIIVRKFLFSNGFRFKKNVTDLPGKPDIVMSKYKTVIFVNGCFWHYHNCKAAKLPATNKEFLEKKLKDNLERDEKNYNSLKDSNWNVIIVWQCEIQNKSNREKRLNLLITSILNNKINCT